jgi:hypothetical protein
MVARRRSHPIRRLGFRAEMRFREAVLPRSRALRVAPTALAALSIALAACGEEDFENEPRPPAPIEVTAAIDREQVSISPGRFGAGIVTITVSNQTDEPTTLVLEGPTNEESGEIVPGGTASIKAELEEGEYEASAGDDVSIEPDVVRVGPERESSQNELLLP